MTMLLLKRLNVPLDRDVIFLAESGEEGNTRVGIGFVTEQHLPEIEAEYCLAEGGGATRIGGQVKYSTIQTLENVAAASSSIARGVAGHGSVPLASNAIVHLAGAVARVGAWRPEIRLNETTRAYFERLAAISPPDVAKHYRGVLSADPPSAAPRTTGSTSTSLGTRRCCERRPRLTSSPVVPLERHPVGSARDARRSHAPDEDAGQVRGGDEKVINDPRSKSACRRPFGRPRASRVGSTPRRSRRSRHRCAACTTCRRSGRWGTGATDMSFTRAKGIQCFGIGPAIDMEDGPRGFGAHSDQERILESELHRFVRLQLGQKSSHRSRVRRRRGSSSRRPTLGMATTKLFTPMKVGNVELAKPHHHRANVPVLGGRRPHDRLAPDPPRHLALSGAALLTIEATAVLPEGASRTPTSALVGRDGGGDRPHARERPSLVRHADRDPARACGAQGFVRGSVERGPAVRTRPRKWVADRLGLRSPVR
jgi:hypothetical protein